MLGVSNLDLSTNLQWKHYWVHADTEEVDSVDSYTPHYCINFIAKLV